jgi:AAA domain
LVDSSKDRRLKLTKSKIVPVASSPTLIQMMVWGRVKSGKTAFACTGPKPIVMEAEKGTMTVRRKKDIQVFPRNQDGTYRPLRWKDTYDFLYYLRNADHDRETVVVDTMSALVRVGMRYINRDEEARDEARPPGTTDQRTWGRLATLVTEFMEDIEEVCQTRGMHLIYTAQERSLNEEQAERVGVDKVPDFTPAIRSFVTERPSILARTFLEDEEGEEIDEVSDTIRYGMTFRDPDLLVGERVTPLGASKPWLPRHAYNVTIPRLVRRIESAEKKEKGA